MAERHILLPCSLPHFRSAQPIWAPPSGGAFFFTQPTQPTQRFEFAYFLDSWSRCLMHSSHAESCIADQKVKTYIQTVDGTPLQILLPWTRVSRHRIEAESSSLSDGPPVWCKSSSLARGPSLAIWLRPYHQAPTSVGASFFPREHSFTCQDSPGAMSQ